MFKFSKIFGLHQTADSPNNSQTALQQLTNDQAMMVAAGNTDPTVKEKLTDKPPVATTNNTYEPPTLPGGGTGARPPFI